MELMTLDEIKLQIRADSDDEDELLTMYGNAAEDYLERYTGVKFNQETLPAIGKIALLMLVANMYENRESAAFSDERMYENKLATAYLERLRQNRGV